MSYTKDSMKKSKISFECTRCEWIWIPRKASPIACPHCKSYEWRGIVPNRETKKAIKEARQGRGVIHHENTKGLFEDLNI